MPKQHLFYYTIHSLLRLLGSLAAGDRNTFRLSFLTWLSYLLVHASSEGPSFEALLQLYCSPLILCYCFPPFWHLPILLTRFEDSEV